MKLIKPRLSIIVAITSGSRAIGNGGSLLVRIADDLKRFKDITSGHAIIMGRKTYESIGRLLPNRENFIVTRNPDFKVPGAVVSTTLSGAIEKAWAHETAGPNENKEIFLIGGGEIYRQGLPNTDKLYLTIIDSNIEGDVYFPEYSEFKRETYREDRVDAKSGIKYSWVNLER